MSFEAWGDDGDFDTDHLIDAGWWTPDQIDELKELVGWIEFPDQPRPGSTHDAALLMVDYLVHGSRGDPNDPHIVWAKRLLAEARAKSKATIALHRAAAHSRVTPEG